MTDLLCDVPKTYSAILCSRQKYFSGRMSSQAPNWSIHVSVHQDVARCILLSYFNDLRIPGPHKDFTLTQHRVKMCQNIDDWTLKLAWRVLLRNLLFLCTQSEHSLWSVQFPNEKLCSVWAPGPKAWERHPPLTCGVKQSLFHAPAVETYISYRPVSW